MNKPEITVVITAHAERPEWLRRAVKSVLMQQDASSVELLIVYDKATEEIADEAKRLASSPDEEALSRHYLVTKPPVAIRAIMCDKGDLGLARNHGVWESSGRYIAFLDGDDSFGCLWLKQAYDYAEKMPHRMFVLHPETNIFFGKQAFIHRHIGDDSPEFDAKDLCQFNQWSALAFAPREVFDKFPYKKAADGYGYEDFIFNVETLGALVSHRCPPDSVHFIRIKGDQTSMANRYVDAKLVIPRMALFDRRDLPDAKAPQEVTRKLSGVIHQQAIFAHRELGEHQIMLNAEMKIRQYPRSRCWKDQAWLRDQIGSDAHLILVSQLHKGGAEKYGMDWALAAQKQVGGNVMLLETQPNDSPWLQKAQDLGIRVVRWKKQMSDPKPEEIMYALQRALIQCELKSLFVCNAPEGWVLLHANPQPLAQKIFAASFATIPIGHGYETCPPFHLSTPLPPNMTIVTDNEAHAKRMREYNSVPVHVIEPVCNYAGPSKQSQIDKKRYRVLWAGRGSPEKNPAFLPDLAAELEQQADIHVWGDVVPMNATENLKYRGPFDGFEKIDGSYDVYINTSITEGMPQTAMEAAMASIPIVAPPIGGLPLLAQATSQLVPKDFARAIISVAKDPRPGPAKILVEHYTAAFAGKVGELLK